MPSGCLVTLDMSEVDEKRRNFQKQDYIMTSVASNTRDLLSDFLDTELTEPSQNSVVGENRSNSTHTENNGASREDSFHHNLPSDLQFLRMDSFPPVSNMQPNSSGGHFHQHQINTSSQNVTSQFPSSYTDMRDTQSNQYAVNTPMEVASSQYQQPSPSPHLSSPSSVHSLQQSPNPSPIQYMMPNDPRSPPFDSIQTSQPLHVTSPQMINEVSSSVENPEKSVQFDEVSSQISITSPSLMPVTHSSPAPALINEPPTVNTGLLQNFIQPKSSAEKIGIQNVETVFTDSNNRFSQSSSPQVTPTPSQFQNLPTGLITSVQNTGLPPGAILVLTPGQFQGTTQINTGNLQNQPQNTANQLNGSQQFQTQPINSTNQFSQQQFQTSMNTINLNQFTATHPSQAQSQVLSTPVVSNQNITNPVQLNQFTSFNPAQLQAQLNSSGSTIVTSPIAKLDSLPPLIIQPNTPVNPRPSSQPAKIGDNDIRILRDKLDNNAYAQLKELLQQLYPEKLNPVKPESMVQVSQSQPIGNVSSDQIVKNILANNRPLQPAANQNINGEIPVPVPIQVDIPVPSQFAFVQTPPVPQTNPDTSKITFAKLLETYLKEQVIKQVKEEELKRKTAVGMETNQSAGFEKIQRKISMDTPTSPGAESGSVQVGQKRQLSPTRLTFPRETPNLGNDSKQLTTDLNNSDMNFTPFRNLLGNSLHASHSEPSLRLSNTQNYRNVEQFSEDLTQFMESNNQMETNQRPKLLISTPSHEEEKNTSSMLRKILTADVDNGNSSPSPSPVSSPDVQLESPSSLSSPNSALYDGNTTLTLLQKSEELNLNSDNLEDGPTSELWNTCTVFSDDDSMVPLKSHKSKWNHDTHSTTFDKPISVDSWFDAGGATNPSSFSFAQSESVDKFVGASEKIETPASTAVNAVTTQTPIVTGGESLKSVVPPVKATNRKQVNKEASLTRDYPSKSGELELRILTQPEEQHRARYLTEGSRGAVKDISQQSYPIIQLLGTNEPTTVQVFIANESGKIKPHGFYQACRVCGKNSTQCVERTIDRTVVIETEILPSPEMTLTVDCVGILKLRNADVENRIGTAKAKASKKNNTKARMVFRVTVRKPDGNLQVLQVASNPILCTQPKGQPEIGRISLSSGSVTGGESLFIIGKNFVKGTKVLFRELALKDGTVIWEREAEIDNEFFQKQHLICTIPEYQNKNIEKPVNVQIVIRCDGKMSDPQKYTYIPVVTTTIKKEVPMETDDESPLSAELKRFVEKAQLDFSASLLQIPSGSLANGFNPSGLTTQPVGSISVAGHPGLQTIAGHDKMIMTPSNPQISMNQQQSDSGNNPQLIMVKNSSGLNQPNLVNLGTSSQNQSQPMIVLLSNNSSVNPSGNLHTISNPTVNQINSNPTPVNPNSSISAYNTQASVEEYLKNLLRTASTNQD